MKCICCGEEHTTIKINHERFKYECTVCGVLSNEEEEEGGTKVVNIFSKPKNAEIQPSGYSFKEVMRRNEKNKARETEDRKKNNRSVTRSYRLKKD